MSEHPASNMSDQPARLLIQQGPNQGSEYELTDLQMTIGRSSVNEIVLNDPEISRRHAQLSRQGDVYTIQDLGSTNGTFVNGQRCTGTVSLKDGDLIEFGDTIRTRFLRRTTQLDPVYDPGFGIPVEEPPTPASSEAPNTTADSQDNNPLLNQRQLVIGCVALFILSCCLLGLLFAVLDSYNDGRLLYCGGLRPFWEAILGPLGFNPNCT